MNTLRSPEESRFRRRIGDWYTLINRYRQQLYELDRKEYLTLKITEHENQVILQRGIGTALQ